MSVGFWIGLAVIPACFVVCFLVEQAVRLLLFTAPHVARGFIGKDSDDHQRARVGAIVFAAKRVTLLGRGNFGVAFFVGLDEDERSKAFTRLYDGGRLTRKPVVRHRPSPR